MARYTGPVCRLCRRERTKLFLKGERCYSMKCPVSEAVTDRHRRAYPPGEHGRDRMRQGSDSSTRCGGAEAVVPRNVPPPPEYGHARSPTAAVVGGRG